ncbi:30S ribosomal protein S6 [Vallitalea guaymasensis]|uniref:Small ribosomal subunit protein bS6 n=1 Tax=Vallitalea guaymasensis TaxID=1185412 RepID=A0A8J8MAS7_9FIRM|nr:30S ribosomal protein S6 [Vallitalea guaymasensis]QUH29478.1 30S ribosomal protein S6 [Vallitalea guaymasensis]
MNNYELAVVINGKVETEVKEAALEKIKGYIERFGGTIGEIDDWGKRRLAYEIDKVKEGYYYFIKFQSSSDAPAEIEKRIRIMEPVLRFLFKRLED